MYYHLAPSLHEVFITCTDRLYNFMQSRACSRSYDGPINIYSSFLPNMDRLLVSFLVTFPYMQLSVRIHIIH